MLTSSNAGKHANEWPISLFLEQTEYSLLQGAHIISNNQAETELGGEASLWDLMSREWLQEKCVVGMIYLKRVGTLEYTCIHVPRTSLSLESIASRKWAKRQASCGESFFSMNKCLTVTVKSKVLSRQTDFLGSWWLTGQKREHCD